MEIVLKGLLGVIPVVTLFVLMLGFKMRGYVSAIITLALTIAIGLWITPEIGMRAFSADASPYTVVGWSLIEGVLKSIFPILLIILMAIYSYNVVVESGAIETIKRQFTQFTDDRGVLVLVMTWGFGGLLEGMAGFGTAVAIPAAILISLGFRPMFSALVALLGNTVPTAFGSVGVPLMTLCNEIGNGGTVPDPLIGEVSAFALVQLIPFFFLVPFAILTLTDKKHWVKNLLLALWTGIVSLFIQAFCAIHFGPEPPAIIGSAVSIAAIIAFDRLFLRKPSPKQSGNISATQALKAWSVYILILLLILVTGDFCRPVHSFLSSTLVTSFTIPDIGSRFRFGWLDNAALMLFIGSIAGGMIQGLGVRRLITVFLRTLVNLRFTYLTITALISISSVMHYCGMTEAIAGGLVAISGSAYPFFAPLIGAIGTFVTGSHTSSNILFGRLQSTVAHQLGMGTDMDFFGIKGSGTAWLAAGNTAGATAGKMISPQSIAIATASCRLKGEEDAILRKALPYAIVYILICGAIVYAGIHLH